MRLVYFCTSPRANEHAGGVKVIYDHSIRLNNSGMIASAIMHERRGYEYPWAEHAAHLISDRELRPTDHLVLPEIKAAQLARILAPSRLKYSIFVQNGYYLRDRDGGCTDGDVDHAYQNASAILSISEDTSSLISLHYPHLTGRIGRVFCSVDGSVFNAEGKKRNLITYMPRKNGAHAAAVVFALKKRLPPSWEIRGIDGMNEAEVAALLKESRIFMSFSGLEGLGLPPVEAALCGNYVIGYHGGGGREYWASPNFEEIAVGDLGAFVRRVEGRVRLLSGSADDLVELEPGMASLRAHFSQESELAALKRFVDKLKVDAPRGATAPPAVGSAPIRLQKRMRLGWWLALRRVRARTRALAKARCGLAAADSGSPP
ncbi:glycosyltransferase [Paraburkholderia sp. 40]|uniref:glycosyltransferase n=1 Tax=Paraburkholderia sp. 40 TaxID=2991059 RepID=UPI003D1A6BB3